MYITYCPVCYVPHKVDERGLIPVHAAESGMPVCDGAGQKPYLVGMDEDSLAG